MNRETAIVVDDGEHEIFVNMKVMDVNNSKFQFSQIEFRI